MSYLYLNLRLMSKWLFNNRMSQPSLKIWSLKITLPLRQTKWKVIKSNTKIGFHQRNEDRKMNSSTLNQSWFCERLTFLETGQSQNLSFKRVKEPSLTWTMWSTIFTRLGLTMVSWLIFKKWERFHKSLRWKIPTSMSFIDQRSSKCAREKSLSLFWLQWRITTCSTLAISLINGLKKKKSKSGQVLVLIFT